MRDYHREGVQPQTAHEALRESYTNPDLTTFVSSLVGPNPPTRKEDMLAVLMRLLEGDQLRLTWDKLTPREQAMVAQTAWSKTGSFDRDKFDAMHELTGSDPDGGEKSEQKRQEEFTFGYEFGYREKRKRSILGLIMPYGVLPRDIQKRLREFVPKPKQSEIRSLVSLPDSFDIPHDAWNPETRSRETTTESVPLVRREMEGTALKDVVAVLRLVDAAKIGITEKNRWPTPSAIRLVAGVLDGGDYYPADESEKKSKDLPDEYLPGPMRAFAWPMLLQAGKLVERRGSHLALTKAGRASLAAAPQETLRDLWDHWFDAELLDELRRIDFISGQTGKGKRALTSPSERRDAIAEALGECPIGQWVALDELSRHMRAAGHEFEVTSDTWSLYIEEQRYGALAYDGYGGWNILQFRYMLCLLMEYVATLGMVDIAFIPPEGARPDYGGMWGTDDFPFFSRYDGLMYLRLTSLGAYALGLQDSYAGLPAEVRQVLTVQPNLEIVATGPLSASDILLLENYAEKTGERVWHLDPPRILDAEAAGRSINELIAFLVAASGTAIPEPVDRFLAELSARAGALRDLGPARLIGCAEPALAHFIANHPVTGKLSMLAGEDHLVVKAKDDPSFHRAVRKLGFVLRQETLEK